PFRRPHARITIPAVPRNPPRRIHGRVVARRAAARVPEEAWERALARTGGHAVEKAVRQSVRQRPRKRSNKRHAQTRSQTDNDSGNLCWFFPVCRPTATGECFSVMSCTDSRTMLPSPSYAKEYRESHRLSSIDN